jgi:indole-3-glycerol phosphate synthase
LRSVQDVAQAAANGFDAVLIGETLMRAGDQLPELLQAMSTIRKI